MRKFKQEIIGYINQFVPDSDQTTKIIIATQGSDKESKVSSTTKREHFKKQVPVLIVGFEKESDYTEHADPYLYSPLQLLKKDEIFKTNTLQKLFDEAFHRMSVINSFKDQPIQKENFLAYKLYTHLQFEQLRFDAKPKIDKFREENSELNYFAIVEDYESLHEK